MDIASLFEAENGLLNKKHIIVTGHYGTGKTNVAVNLALALAEKEAVCLIDLDIVNPYFRSSDNRSLLEEHGVRVYSPNFANTNLDAPSLPAEIYAVFGLKARIIWDVGGDDDGATALGRFASKIAEQDYAMLYTVNKFRPLTETPEDMEEYLRAIEVKSRLKATAIVNNSNLAYLTDADTVAEGKKCADALAKKTGLPIAFTCVCDDIRLCSEERIFRIKICTLKI